MNESTRTSNDLKESILCAGFKIYGIICILLAIIVYYHNGLIFVGIAPAYNQPPSNFGVPGAGFFHFIFSGDFFIEGAGRLMGIILLVLTGISMIFDVRVLQKFLIWTIFLLLALVFFPMFFIRELVSVFIYFLLLLQVPLLIKASVEKQDSWT